MFKENDLLVLTSDILGDEGELGAGNVGTVVHVHPGNTAFVVEFMAPEGVTLTTATVLPSQARIATHADIEQAPTTSIP